MTYIHIAIKVTCIVFKGVNIWLTKLIMYYIYIRLYCQKSDVYII